MGISRATLADAHRLSVLARETFPLACPPGTSPENIALFCERNLSESSFSFYLGEESHKIWVASKGDSFMGYVMSIGGEPKDSVIAGVVSRRPTVEISKIYVASSAQGSGLSSELMSAAIEEAKAQGAASVWLGVNQHNERANRFYQRWGFEIVGERTFAVGDSLESDFVRELIL